MSIETERKRLTDFLKQQTAAHGDAKRRAKDHCDKIVALADASIEALAKHTAEQIAALDAARKAQDAKA